jgi:hypothetical protein
MLNLLFDPRNQDGRFVETPPPASALFPLLQSRHWLRLNGPDPASLSTFDPENQTIWDDLGAVGTLLLPKATPAIPDPGYICIRIAPVSCTPPPPAVPTTAVTALNPTGMTLRLVASFGRPIIAARTPRASPFSDGAALPQIFTTFIAPDFTVIATGGGLTGTPPVPNPAPNTTAGWFFSLGKINARSPVPTPASAAPFLTDRYEFSVGAIAIVPGTGTRHYGDDPEMDVGQ